MRSATCRVSASSRSIRTFLSSITAITFSNGAAYRSGVNGRAIHPAGFWNPFTNNFGAVTGLQHADRRDGAG